MTDCGLDEADDSLVPISALQHYLYCPRQCALIHVERQWAENRFTAEGGLLHENAHGGDTESRGSRRILRGLEVRSRRLGVAGVADVVEVEERWGRLYPYPVEYKRGRPKAHRADEVQLCAQALALEEAFGVEVLEGYLFYGEPRRRTRVTFDATLRRLTADTVAATRHMIVSGRTPPPHYEPKRCDSCSLATICRPRCLESSPNVVAWIDRRIDEEP